MDWLAALGSLLMFLLLLSCSNDMFVCLFYTFQKSFCPARDESELEYDFLPYELPSSIQSRLDPDFAIFYFVLFWKNSNTKNQKISLIILK